MHSVGLQSKNAALLRRIRSLSLLLLSSATISSHGVMAASSRANNIVCPDNGVNAVELALKEYNYRHGGRFRMKRVSSDVYDLQLQKYLSFGRLPALFCTDPSGASKYYKDGWIEHLNGIQNYKKIKDQMLPNMKQSVTNHDLLLGVPYAGTVTGVALVQDVTYGSDSFIKPLGWQQLYESAVLYTRQLKKPTLLPAWGPEVIADTYITEMMNRSRFREQDGMNLAGDVGRQILVDWKQALDLKTVPEDSLSIDKETAESRLKSGIYIYGVTSLKDYLSNMAASAHRANQYSLLSGWGQNWGMLDVRILAMTKQNDRSESEAEGIRRFIHWFIFDDKSTKINDTEYVLEKAKLFPAFRLENKLKVSTAALTAAHDSNKNIERALSIYRRAKYPASVLAVPTAHQFKEGLALIITDFLHGDFELKESLWKIKTLMNDHGIVSHT